MYYKAQILDRRHIKNTVEMMQDECVSIAELFDGVVLTPKICCFDNRFKESKTPYYAYNPTFYIETMQLYGNPDRKQLIQNRINKILSYYKNRLQKLGFIRQIKVFSEQRTGTVDFYIKIYTRTYDDTNLNAVNLYLSKVLNLDKINERGVGYKRK